MDQRSTFIEGKYEILGKIREGGMGAIYKVRHRLLDEVRVVKVMKPQVLADEDLRRRFAEEAKTATRLKHPNICTIHDFSLDPDGTAYLVMEFIDGVTLAELGKSSTPVSIPMTVEIAAQALLALGYLHRRNVVHRDIAPDNLMLTSDEEGAALVKLIDLGIAKTLDRPGDLTSTGVFLGKLKYASPEQYGALAPGEKIDGRSDLYCLGLVLYELVTGVRPFVGETPAEMIRAHLFAAPKPFSETDPEGRVPPEMRAAILKALEKKREDRYATADDFLRDIARLKDGAPRSTDVDSTQRFVSNVRLTQQVTGVGVTPSAQGRLDRRFGVQATPHPIRSATDAPATTQPWDTPTRATLVTPSSPAPAGKAAAAPLPGTPRKGRGRLVLAAVLVAAAAGAVIVVRSAGRSPAAAPAAAAEPAPPESGAVTPSAPTPALERSPSAEPPAAIAVAPIVPTETSQPTAAPAPARAESRPRPTREPIRRTPVARIAQNEIRHIVPTSVPAPAATQPPVAVVVPTAVPPPPPTARPQLAPAATAPPAGPSDTERIREVVRQYERAQNALDADLYSRVYPGADRSRVQSAFDGIRSQAVTFDQIRIEIAPPGNRATAHLHEHRVAVPRVGNEQTVDGNRTVLLQKEGDRWVIVGMQ